MTEYLKQILINQFEAALAMLKFRIEACPEEHWDDKVGEGSFRQDAYHVLFFCDYYLSAHEDEFTLREVNIEGGDEREPVICKGVGKAAILEYMEYCHVKIQTAIALETEESLQGNSGFPSIFRQRPITRGELHIYNIRHLQHHGAQMAVILRRLSNEHNLRLKLPWVGTGWR